MNAVGKGDWVQCIQATLRPSASGQVGVSPTAITVDEGATVTYTIRLSTAPPHPAGVNVQPRGPAGSEDLQGEILQYQGRVMIPNGWTHPHGADWSGLAYNWSQGVKVTFTAPEDSDVEDDIVVVDHFVYAVPYIHYRPCSQGTQAERDQCRQDWDDAWANSPYRQLAGASVMVTVRDND